MNWHLLSAPRRLCLLPALVVVGLALPVRAQTVAASTAQPLADIAAAAEAYARALLPETAADAEVRAGALDSRLRLKTCELPLEAFGNGTELRGSRVTVGVRCTGAAPWTLYVPVAVVAETSIVVVQGPLPRGTLLNESHLRLERRAMTALPPQYIASFDQAIGRELSRAVSGATVATPAMLQARDLVTKGQDVVILATGTNIQVRMAGIALQKGQQGERIAVRNSTSGKTLEAVIVDGSTVQVHL